MKTGHMQVITFTPSPPVCRPVVACAGPVEFVDEGHDRSLFRERNRIYRVRSLRTGAQCWAYIDELTVDSVA